MWQVYILQCSDDSLYVGITNNLTKRIKDHQSGKASKYTRSRLPVRLVYKENKLNKGNALRREYEIKKWPRSKKIAFLTKFLRPTQ